MTQRPRLALRSLTEFETPLPGPRLHVNEGHVRSDKRARTIETPSGSIGAFDTPMLINDRPNSSSRGMLDYLQERGGRIKELEDEIGRYRTRQEQLIQEVHLKQQQVAVLQQDLAAAKSEAVSQKHLSSQFEHEEIEKLLESELSKAMDIEAELRETQNRLHATERKASDAVAESRRTEAEMNRRLHEAQLKAEMAERQLEVIKAECDGKVHKAVFEADLERKRREAEQEISRTALRQLEEAHGEVAVKSSELRKMKQMHQSAAVGNASSSILLQRVRELEEVVKVQEKQIRSLKDLVEKSTVKGGQEHCKPDALSERLGPSREDTGASEDVGVAAACGSVLCKSSPSSSQQQQQQVNRLVEWEAGKLQHQLSEAAELLTQHCSIQLLPSHDPLISNHDPGMRQLWSAQDAERVLALLVKQVGDLKQVLAQKDCEMLALSVRGKGLDKQLREVSDQLAQKNVELQAIVLSEKTASRQLNAITQERDALRRALSVPTILPKPDSVSGKILSEQQAGQVRELQTLVSELQRQLELAQRDASVAAASATEQRVEAAAARSRADAAEAKVVQLEKEADGLALDVATLHEKLGRGEVNRSSVRVLHMKMNPETQLYQETNDSALKELQAEKEVLSSRLKELAVEVERLRSSSSVGLETSNTAGRSERHATPREEHQDVEGGIHAVTVRDAQIAVLTHRLREMEKSMTRLKEVTKERVVAFREACYSLFGYRVDMSSQATAAKDAAIAPTIFSLKPQHADHPDLMLVFRFTPTGGMELVQNQYSSRWSREVDTFINKFKSIPAFTANLTIENFQKQTQC